MAHLPFLSRKARSQESRVYYITRGQSFSFNICLRNSLDVVKKKKSLAFEKGY